MDVTVAIATFGDDSWIDLALSRARPSVEDVPVVMTHGASLHEARNEALALVESEWVVFLDADDEIEPGYFRAMETGTADLRAPAVRYVRPGREFAPQVPRVAGHRHECDAQCVASGAGNWLVIGTAARTEQVLAAGGFRDWPVFEDYDLWLRMVRAGATVEAIPEAVYRAHVRPESRNRAGTVDVRNEIHRQINESVGLGMGAAA